MSPADWSGGVQGVPDKNDILDVMIHLRRAGIYQIQVHMCGKTYTRKLILLH